MKTFCVTIDDNRHVFQADNKKSMGSQLTRLFPSYQVRHHGSWLDDLCLGRCNCQYGAEVIYTEWVQNGVNPWEGEKVERVVPVYEQEFEQGVPVHRLWDGTFHKT